MIVSTNDPYSIYATCGGCSDFLGYTEAELHRQSIRLICGPWTNVSVLFAAIAEASASKTTIVFLKFRDKFGNPWDLSVQSSPFHDDLGHVNGCILSFEKFKNYSHFEYGCCISSEINDSHDLLSLQPHTSHTNTAAADIGFFKTCGAATPTHSEPHSPEAYSSPYASETDRPGSAVRIHPRRKRGVGPEAQQSAIEVSLETVLALQDLPVHEAAGRIGISATALKKACRKLGVNRWSYRRVPGPPPAAPAHAETPPDDAGWPASPLPRSALANAEASFFGGREFADFDAEMAEMAARRGAGDSELGEGANCAAEAAEAGMEGYPGAPSWSGGLFRGPSSDGGYLGGSFGDGLGLGGGLL
jgi:hypothetical protein